MKRYLGWAGLLLLGCAGAARGNEPYDVSSRPARNEFNYRLDAARPKGMKAKRLRMGADVQAIFEGERLPLVSSS